MRKKGKYGARLAPLALAAALALGAAAGGGGLWTAGQALAAGGVASGSRVAAQGAAAADGGSQFSDVKAGAWYDTTIRWAVASGIVKGYGDGTFKPAVRVSEAEFVAMLLRASEAKVGTPAAGEKWYAPYYVKAAEYGMPVAQAERERTVPLKRGRAALLVAAYAGKQAGDETAAIQFLLDSGISKGKTAPTVKGYAAGDTLTRAEAVSFVRQVVLYAESLDPSQNGGSTQGGTTGNGTGGTNSGTGNTGGNSNTGNGNGNGNGNTGGNNGNGSGNGNTGGNNGNGNGNGNNNDERPADPGTAADTAAILKQELAAQIAALGLVLESTDNGYKVPHPDGKGTGAVLTRTDAVSGEVLIVDAADASLAGAGYALLRSAGVTLPRQRFDDAIAAIGGGNISLKAGKQTLAFVRALPSGSLTIRYALEA